MPICLVQFLSDVLTFLELTLNCSECWQRLLVLSYFLERDQGRRETHRREEKVTSEKLLKHFDEKWIIKKKFKSLSEKFGF